MVVDTRSDATTKAQDGILEFLLINHPLDCPVCDKGGECPLQDQTLAYGPGESRFVEEKRHYAKPIPLSDLVLMDRERCILCDRCTRFADEVAGDPLISFIGRGADTQVNTFPDEPFSSYFSGNTIQICPVGALTAEPFRFRARPWDLANAESTCTSCSVGLPGRPADLPRRPAAQERCGRGPRELGLALRPGALRPLVRQQSRAPGHAAGAHARRQRPDHLPLVRGADRGSRRPEVGGVGPRRRPRRRPAHQRVGLRVGQAGQGGHRHRPRGRPAGRWAARRPGPRSAEGHHRPGLRAGHHGRPPRPGREGGAAGPVPAPPPRRRERRGAPGRGHAGHHRPHPLRHAHRAPRPRGRRRRRQGRRRRRAPGRRPRGRRPRPPVAGRARRPRRPRRGPAGRPR